MNAKKTEVMVFDILSSHKEVILHRVDTVQEIFLYNECKKTEAMIFNIPI